ncbi:hypothetical protein NE237_003750 [Protea cynaroides]|uniref:Uncharacterized protein n=1 Tax=Protea cynaroides TaxID=273540 RepID=A0A9Q0KHZ2_9MAGN|nr:hypothetical protein NE237_003750 [Protea cynaroides]
MGSELFEFAAVMFSCYGSVERSALMRAYAAEVMGKATRAVEDSPLTVESWNAIAGCGTAAADLLCSSRWAADLMESRTALVDRWTSVGDSSCAKVAGSIVAADQGVDLVAGGPCRSSIGMLVGDAENTARPQREGPSDPVQVVYQVRISITISSHVESMFLLVEGGTRQSVNQVLDRFSGGKSGDPLLHERSMDLRISLDLEGSDHRSVRREVADRAAEYLLEEHRSVDVTIAGSKADDMADRRGQPTVGSTVSDMGTVAVGNQKVSFHYPQMLRTL